MLCIAIIVLLLVSILCSIYTYIFFPLILKLIRGKEYKRNQLYAMVSIVLVADASERIQDKVLNIESLDYPSHCIEMLVTDRKHINETIEKASGEILVFTNAVDMFDKLAIAKLVECFSDERIGAACGVMQISDGKGSVLWKYENAVRRYESSCGQLSGANNAVFAVRKQITAPVPDGLINYTFYLSVSALLSGFDCILNDDAKAFGVTEKVSFEKHVLDGVGNFQLIWLFRRLLLPVRGSFIFVSHRVLKWTMPVNLILIFLCSIVLGLLHSRLWFILLAIQICAYASAGIFYYIDEISRYVPSNSINRLLYRLFSILTYFVLLNAAYMIGLVKWLFIPEYHVKKVRSS